MSIVHFRVSGAALEFERSDEAGQPSSVVKRAACYEKGRDFPEAEAFGAAMISEDRSKGFFISDLFFPSTTAGGEPSMLNIRSVPT